ncbi:uncharacterized protein METZ01_LOCUS500086, partial [marine metagenome]
MGMRSSSVKKVCKGRGAVSNPPGRFEKVTTWAVSEDGEGASDGGKGSATQLSADRTRSIIRRNESPDIEFDQSINPYLGCEHGCVYCYARPSHSYLGLSAGKDFESRIFVKPEAGILLRQELCKLNYRCRTIALGT